LTSPRVIFVPGLNPKPPSAFYRPQLLRVVLAGLNRAKPEAAAWLEAHPDSFRLVAWTYLFYGAHRDITVDMPGIERLLAQTGPSPSDLREIRSWSHLLKRWSHVIGDALPAVGRLLARPATRRLMHEANRYLKNRDGVGETVRSVLRDELEEAWQAGAPVLLIGHSLGSVIAYDTLWAMSREPDPARRVDLFVTMGSPLATHFVQRSLAGAHEQGAARYPRNVRRWVNCTAHGDTTALQARLAPRFAEMLELGLVESIEDVVGFDNYFRGITGINEHEAYGYLSQPVVGAIIGDWLERVALRPAALA
jgi:pimeloyl-ACP methyl ester carboxylesterase